MKSDKIRHLLIGCQFAILLTGCDLNKNNSPEKIPAEIVVSGKEQVACLNGMAFIRQPNGNLDQIRTSDGKYMECNPDMQMDSTGKGSNANPLFWHKGNPTVKDRYYNVGGVTMKALASDPLGIRDVKDLFPKSELDKRQKF